MPEPLTRPTISRPNPLSHSLRTERANCQVQSETIKPVPMLCRRPCPGVFLRLFATSCRSSSLHPSQPHLQTATALPTLPVAKKVPFNVSAHGRSWSDPYHWMRNTSDPDLAVLLAAENAYADAFVGSAGGGGLRARLAAEMRVWLPASTATPPQLWGPWFVSRCLVVLHCMTGNVLGWISKFRRF
jgi:hypothetical protein